MFDACILKHSLVVEVFRTKVKDDKQQKCCYYFSITNPESAIRFY